MDKKDTKDKSSEKTIQSDIVLEIGSKMQKIVTAIYMVTDLIQEKDPIRKDLRVRSVYALSSISSISVKNSIQAQKAITKTQAVVDSLVNILKIAVSIGFVSDMNFKLITESLSLIKDDLNKKYSLLQNQDNLSKTFHNRAVEEFVLPTTLFNGQEDKTEKKNEAYQTKPNFNMSDKKKPETSIPKNKNIQKSPSSRESDVLDLVREKGEVSVSDVALRFSEVSEKTVQRILVKLVDNGYLQKTGEKRWSRYSVSR